MLILFLTSPAASAQEIPPQAKPRILALDEAVQTALRQNPGVIISKSRHEEARANVTVERAGYLPRVNGSAMDSFGLGGSSQAIGITGLVNSPYRKNWAGGFDASWTLFDFGRTAFKVKAAKKEAEARGEEVNQNLAEVKFLVTRAYTDCAFGGAINRLLQERENRQKLLGEEIEKYVKAGLVSPVDLNLAKASLEETHARQAEALGQSQQAIERLKELMGEPPQESFDCELPKAALTDPEPLASLLESALKNRPELRAAQKLFEAAHSTKRAAQWEHAPRLVAVASVGIFEEASLVQKKDWSTGVGVTVPLFDGFLAEGKVRKARALEVQAKAKLEEWKNRIHEEVAGAYAVWEGAKKSHEALNVRYRLAEKAYVLAHRRYWEKMGTFTEFRDAESAFDKSAQEKLAGETNYFLAYQQLKIVTHL